MALRVANVTRSDTDARDRAFEHLFVKEYRRVVAIAYRVLNDAAEAEDIAQEAFTALHRRHSPDASYASAWLHRAASHLALNAVRSRRRRERREREEEQSRVRSQGVQSISLDPSQQVELSEQQHAVRQILSRLPERHAQVLALRYSGLSYAEVAAAMGCKVGDVGTMLRRADETFRKEMDRETR
jgi:RNA polymerase sigma factor (sigma-70 family)